VPDFVVAAWLTRLRFVDAETIFKGFETERVSD
jgi:hypothetical protein